MQLHNESSRNNLGLRSFYNGSHDKHFYCKTSDWTGLHRLTERRAMSSISFQESQTEHWQPYKRHRLALVILLLSSIPAVRLGSFIHRHLHLVAAFGIFVP